MFPIASLFANLPPLKIVDVGAAAGSDPPAYARLLQGLSCDVVGFEPDMPAFERLIAAAKAGHSYLPYVIGDGSRHAFYHCSAPHCSSLFEPDTALAARFHNLAELLEVVDIREVETRRLDDIEETEGVDFLKLDVQGGELLVLQGAEARLKQTLVVHTEVEFVPLYKNQPLFADIDMFLRARGFSFHTLVPSGRSFKPLKVNDADTGWIRQILWADAVYVRNFMEFDRQEPLALLKLAAILHQNYQSLDLAAHALAAYDRKTGSGVQTAYLRRLQAG